MKVTHKLFLAMAALVVVMGMIMILVTQFVVKPILQIHFTINRSQELERLSQSFIQYYQNNQNRWAGVRQLSIDRAIPPHHNVGLLLTSPKKETLYTYGQPQARIVKHLGIKKPLQTAEGTIALLYYYDAEVGQFARKRAGITSSVTFLLLITSMFLVLVSLAIAYALAKRLSKPLKVLIPPIEKLGMGAYGIQAPVITKDEYATITQAFNVMSRQLKEAETLRRNLMADVAHELRTPLTILSGKLDYIQQTGKPVRPETLLPLQDELIRLTRLVEDLRLLSLAEAKKLPLVPAPTDLSELLSNIIDHLTPRAEEQGIRLTLVCHTDHTTITIDSNRITQVFLNLLTNALHYTPNGGSIAVELDVQTQSDQLQITITDTGMGIDEEHLPHLFHRFYRPDASHQRDHGGTGLGLPIAKEYVLAHQGTIDVTSTPNQGTCFIIRLPLTDDSSQAKPSADQCMN